MQVLYLLFFLSLSFNNTISMSNSISIGYDSNPMKLSSDEIDESAGNIFMDKYNISSKYIKLNTKFQTSIPVLKRKTKIDFSIKTNYYSDLDEKSNYGIYFKMNQPIGGYQYVKLDYTFIPDIFLREYDDSDYIYQYFDFIQDISYKCFFNLSKISIKYQRPINNKNNRISFILNQETQYYNKSFTEFDLRINGVKVLFNKKYSNANYSISYEYDLADNITLFDGNTSTSLMDRGYDEGKLKISFSRKFGNFSIGGSFNNIDRTYSSEILQDALHLNRKHIDKTLIFWFKFKVRDFSHKISFSNRDRITSSPQGWVQDLKTFSRYDASYSFFFKKISFGK